MNILDSLISDFLTDPAGTFTGLEDSDKVLFMLLAFACVLLLIIFILVIRMALTRTKRIVIMEDDNMLHDAEDYIEKITTKEERTNEQIAREKRITDEVTKALSPKTEEKIDFNIDDKTRELILPRNEELDKLVKSKTSISISSIPRPEKKEIVESDKEETEELLTEEETTAIDLAAISKRIEEDLKSKTIELTEYEVEQEENAIISYEELVAKMKKDRQVEAPRESLPNEPLLKEIDTEVPLMKSSLNSANTETELMKTLEVLKSKPLIEEKDEEEYEDKKIERLDIEDDFIEKEFTFSTPKKFENSAIISPVFGVKPDEEEPSIFDNHLESEEVEVLDFGSGEENENFLDSLKKLREEL